MEHNPIWREGVRLAKLPRLEDSIDVDVCVVGGGITGLTAALLAASDGRRVVLLEADGLGSGTTGATSAHVSAVPDIGYRAVLRQCGPEAGSEYVARCASALELMDSLVRAERISCSWDRVAAYWYSEDAHGVGRLKDEASAADRLGQECRMVREVPLPWPTAGGLAIPRQAIFHPLRYLQGLARIARARGAQIFEASPVLSWDEDDRGVVVRTACAEVRAAELILATHTPLGVNLVQAELAAVHSYILTLALPKPLPAALFWDTDEPYHYVRPLLDGAQPLALVGGADHKTGCETDPQSRYAALSEFARRRLPEATITGWWSAQFYEPADGMPYIGRSPLTEHVYIATGFAGVGLVQGTMAAMDLVAQLRGEGRDTPWRPSRVTLAAAPRVISEGVAVAMHWLGDRLSATDGTSAEALPAGQGRILRLDGQRCAGYRDDDGRLHVLSPACTHLGCLVRWNGSARTWDCPCHGSRYAPTGEVLEGPALSALARRESSQAEPYSGMPSATPAPDAQRLDTVKG
ncbi:MAG: FAD-dependent oxidoreductase [bacterium]